MTYWIITGREHGDDEDSSAILEAATREDAIRLFVDNILCFIPAVGDDSDPDDENR